MTEIVFPDPQGYADLATLVRRARQADPEAAVRLQVAGRVLRVWVGVLPGSGLLADGAAVGVRGIELAGEAQGGAAAGAGASELDLVCAGAALTERFAHDGVGACRLSVPPASTYAAWAGALPPAAGWSAAGSIPAAALIDAARGGIAEIAEGVDADHTGVPAGSRAVQQLRRRVWSRPVAVRTGAPAVGIPAGAAFAAYVLGFVPEPTATVRVWVSGRWVRLQTAHGHVLARP
jgi:hypothetical protein